MLTVETLTTLDAQIAAARKAVDKAHHEKWCAECSDDFLYSSGRVNAYNDDIRAAEKRLADLIETRDVCRERLIEKGNEIAAELAHD
jgi:hypothetical protein